MVSEQRVTMAVEGGGVVEGAGLGLWTGGGETYQRHHELRSHALLCKPSPVRWPSLANLQIGRLAVLSSPT